MQVTREVLLPDPAEDVWRALTEAERLSEWFANDVELDAVPGGTGRFDWSNGEAREARVEIADEGRLFVFTWGTAPDGDDASRVEIELEPAEDGGTRVRVTETALGLRAALGEWSVALSVLALAGTLAVA